MSKRSNNCRGNTPKETFRGNSNRSGKGNNRNNTRKYGSAKNVPKDEDIKEDMMKEGHNDFAWINKNPELLKDAASINTTSRTGYRVPLPNSPLYTQSNVRVPGILSMLIYPSVPTNGSTPGDADSTDAVNLCSLNTYSFYRHANSGSANYDAPDLFMGVQAAGEAYAAFCWGKRAYDTLTLYNQRNRYVPEALIRAQGFDFAACNENPARFRGYINQIVAKMSVLWVPKTLPFIKRLSWLFSNIYTDSSSAKAQMYVFSPAAFHKFETTGNPKGSSLSVKTINYNSTGLTPKDWFDYMNDLLENLISDEDMGIMFGDMLKAYGADNIYTITPVPEFSGITPVHNAEVLSQIMNSVSVGVKVGGVKQTDKGVIYQDSGDVAQNYMPLDSGCLLNFWSDNPTYEEVAEATRLTALADVTYVSPGAGLVVPRCSTAYISNYRIWYYEGNTLKYVNFGNTINEAAPQLNLVTSLLSQFDWHPQVFIYKQGPVSEGQVANNTLTGLYFDLDNYTGIDKETLMRIHDVAIMSEYDVPIKV